MPTKSSVDGGPSDMIWSLVVAFAISAICYTWFNGLICVAVFFITFISTLAGLIDTRTKEAE